MQNNGTIKVVELFAGVGGFRLGLERCSPRFETVWANQWEPDKKSQHAFDCYISHFGANENHINKDINMVKNEVPEHDLLVGGFPCQDYSVARTGAKGIEGKKGTLWWDIDFIIKNRNPKYVLLENVDRLIKSPASQHGRDFAIMLRCLYDAGYAVEWRVINAADYGHAQKRRRVFIFAYKNTTEIYNDLYDMKTSIESLKDWMQYDGFFADIFPVQKINLSKKLLTDISSSSYDDLIEISNSFNEYLYNSGVMIDGVLYSEETTPIYISPIPLKDIIHKGQVDERYFLNGSLEKWGYLKGSKKIERKRPNGEIYYYSEGGMNFPDDLNSPARTMLTSESSINRSTHVVEDFITKRLRLLTPIECERINGFDDGWTDTGMPEKSRYFVMGNALVVPLITKIGNKILTICGNTNINFS